MKLDLSKLGVQPTNPNAQPAGGEVKRTTNRASAPEAVAPDGSTSVYEPAWKAVKQAGYNGVQINLHFAREEARIGRKLTQAEKEKLFNRLRKALSHRKEVDLLYRAENPSSKLIVISKNYETGAAIIALRYHSLDCSFSDLAPIDFQL